VFNLDGLCFRHRHHHHPHPHRHRRRQVLTLGNKREIKHPSSSSMQEEAWSVTSRNALCHVIIACLLMNFIMELIKAKLIFSFFWVLFQVLSRTSSGSAANSVSGSPNVASVPGSSAESNSLGFASYIGPVGGVNFQQAEEDFQLQLALALRVAAEAAAVDDPDLNANTRGPIDSKRLMPGVSKVEAIAYRYWVS